MQAEQSGLSSNIVLVNLSALRRPPTTKSECVLTTEGNLWRMVFVSEATACFEEQRLEVSNGRRSVVQMYSQFYVS